MPVYHLHFISDHFVIINHDFYLFELVSLIMLMRIFIHLI